MGWGGFEVLEDGGTKLYGKSRIGRGVGWAEKGRRQEAEKPSVRERSEERPAGRRENDGKEGSGRLLRGLRALRSDGRGASRPGSATERPGVGQAG